MKEIFIFLHKNQHFSDFFWKSIFKFSKFYLIVLQIIFTLNIHFFRESKDERPLNNASSILKPTTNPLEKWVATSQYNIVSHLTAGGEKREFMEYDYEEYKHGEGLQRVNELSAIDPMEFVISADCRILFWIFWRKNWERKVLKIFFSWKKRKEHFSSKNKQTLAFNLVLNFKYQTF